MERNHLETPEAALRRHAQNEEHLSVAANEMDGARRCRPAENSSSQGALNPRGDMVRRSNHQRQQNENHIK